MDSIDEMIIKKAGNVADEKSATNMANMNKLMHAIRDYFEESLDVEKDKKYFDEGLGEKLSSAIVKAFENLSKLPTPQVTVKPNINVDLAPINSLASEISKQNKSIIDLLSKMGNGEDYDKQCYKMIMTMVQKNNTFVERIFKEVDYSKPLSEIAAAINQNNQVKELTIKRNTQGFIQSIIPVYEK